MGASSSEGDVNALAASLEQHGQDVSLYAGMLLNTLSAALPDRLVVVERQRSLRLLRRGTPAAVTALTISVGDRRFRLERARTGAFPHATVEHIVRGIVLSSDDVPLTEWTDALAVELTEAAGRDAGVAEAIDLLIRGPGLP
jgi:hypothetical protein